MDTYGHLFPSLNRGWADSLDEQGTKGLFASALHPLVDAVKAAHGGSGDKYLETKEKSMVAVPRIERGTRGL